MDVKRLPGILLSFFLLLGAGQAVAQPCPNPPTSPADKAFPAKQTANFTHIANVTGSWNAPGTWNTGTIPGNGAVVCIPAGLQVTVNSQEISRLRYVQVNGTLRMWIHSSTRLFLDTLYIASGGTFVVGDSVNTVKPGVLAEIVFISWNGSPIDRTWDMKEKTRGLFSDGTVRVFGEAKTHMRSMTADALKNATTLTVDNDSNGNPPVNWQIGDKLVLTGSYFREVGAPTSSQDEKLTITSIAGNVIGFMPALVYDHVRPRSDLKLHVANLTRNFVFRSESTTKEMRGHIMLVNGTVDLRHVALENLGRTDKSVPLDDFVVTKTPDGLNYSIAARADSLINNRRGRYALHLHQNGTFPGSAPPTKVYNSVVNGTTSWGFVSHNSHVDFLNNVAYDFVGAGFVTEAGSELGNFDNNIAIRGTGNGEYRTNRIVFANLDRPQPLADFAFSGDGFWFQGPAVRARNNVASGCDGAGMIWFTTGQPDVEQIFTDTGGFAHDRYTHFPKSALSTVYSGFSPLPQPRYWDHSDPIQKEKLVISDLPILECDGFHSYGNLVGFRLRFNNASNVAWYGENPFNFNVHLLGGAGTRVWQQIKNLTLWNNELAFRPNYTSKGDWTNVLAMNRLDYNTQSPYIGAEIDFNITETIFRTLTIDGYEVAGKIENCSNNARTDIMFLVSKTYDNYANVDTWHQANPCNGAPPPTCAAPTGVTVSPSNPTSISWTASPSHLHFLVRYRLNGAQQWNMVDTAGTSVSLGTLAPGQYTYQVIASCKDGAGKETAPSSYTAAATFTR
jgi:hypothetical protein